MYGYYGNVWLLLYIRTNCQGFPGVTYPLTSDDTPVVLDTSQPIKVFTDLEVVKTFLTDTQFVICNSQDEADIIWTTKQIKDFT